MASLHLEVRGRVQGVGFRWFVVERANDLKLAGWVKNKPDGSVEVAASGPSDALAGLESAVKSGPRGARIDDVHVLPGLPDADLPNPFRIAR
jgi:acylphosphatase